jgi:hypothetical protein
MLFHVCFIFNMNRMEINYLAILVCGVLSMVIGSIWYGPLFGKKWMEICGVNSADLEVRKKMQKEAGLLYGVQFVLTLFQVLVLAHLIADTVKVSGLERSLWIYVAFVMPIIAGCSMWTAEPAKRKWARFLIQSGYQLVLFVMFGIILTVWK